MADTPFDHTVITGLQERIKALAPARLEAHGLVPGHASPSLDGRQALYPRVTDQPWHHRWPVASGVSRKRILAAYPLL